MAGTNLQVKNLFFNVPARRNFLKSSAIEMRHVLDEFQRIALANPDVFFSLHHNATEIFHLPPANLRQRIVGIFGNAFNPKLVPVKEETDILKITGFIGKPEFARKVRGEQFFFVNNRFIKSGYLHHAVMAAYEELLPKDTFPFYVIFIEIDPASIDINVHPTKQEIKFDDERLVYNYLKVAVRHALGRHNITPTLDFEQEASFSPTQNFGLGFQMPRQEDFERELSQTVNTFGKASPPSTENFERSSSQPSFDQRESNNLKNWQKLFEGLEEFESEAVSSESSLPEGAITIESQWSGSSELDDAGNTFSRQQKEPYQIHATYIVSQIKSGFLLIDQQAAHERILYEHYLNVLENQQALTQKELFPKTINLPPADAALLSEMLPQVNLLGYDIQEFGKDTFIIHGVPADLPGGQDESKIIETLLRQFRQNVDLSLDARDNLARSMARSAAIKRGQALSVQEMQELVDKLFACSMPYRSPGGRACFVTFELDELEKRFE
ncbi:MAG: DNA mismatch repair endonuclease MutL [Bacteroidota bacterium]